MANTLTAARVLLALPFAFFMAREGAWAAALAALVFAAAIATDLLDGPVARRRGAATEAGGVFDHAADCFFVTSGLAAGAARGALPWVLPALVVVAFVQYIVDSYWMYRGRALRRSALGRYNGILYFAPLGGDVLVRLGIVGLRPAVTALAWALVATTALSMGERLWAVTRLRRRVLGSPGAGRGDRPRR